MKTDKEDILSFTIPVGVFLLIFGSSLWAGVLGFEDFFLRAFGCIMFAIGTSALVFIAYKVKTKKLISALFISACIMTVMFCVFAMVGAVPGVPYHPVYGMIAAPFIIAGGTVTTVDVVRIKIKNKKGQFEEREYEITKETYGKQEKIKKIRRIK